MASDTWADPEWEASVSDWINAQLERRGAPPFTNLERVTENPTSCVLRAHMTDHVEYFKATASPFNFEPQLTLALAAKMPDGVPPVLAIDAQRGWILMADGGKTLRQFTQTEDKQVIDGSLAHWHAMLTHYARLQRSTLPNLSEFQAAGCPSRRLSQLPGLYRMLIADRPALASDDEDALSSAQIDRLPAFTSEV